jgi:hypothetical protein
MKGLKKVTESVRKLYGGYFNKQFARRCQQASWRMWSLRHRATRDDLATLMAGIYHQPVPRSLLIDVIIVCTAISGDVVTLECGTSKWFDMAISVPKARAANWQTPLPTPPLFFCFNL